MLIWFERLEDGLFQKSRSMGPPWGPTVRWLRYPAALIRDWLGGEINVRAMSLAYTTLLSIVPLMVFSFAILKGLGARGDLKFILHQFFRPMGSAAPQLTDSVLQFVTNMRGELLGSIGLAFLVYTVLATIQKVEGSFNFVWRVERPRSFGRRFTEYLSVMILGPILLAVAIGLLGSAEHSPFAQWLHAVAPLAGAMDVLGQIVPYAIVTVVFTFMYSFIPNTRVQFRAALIGGVTAGLIWALVGKLFTAVILYSSQMVAVYTGFAIVLTTLIWVYLSWLILLIGAQLAFYVQFPQYLRHGQETIELSGADREQMGLSIMFLIGRDYGAGKSFWSAGRLAAELDVPGIALAPVLACLERAGLLVATEKEQFVPGRDPEGILLADILGAVRRQQIGRLTIEVHGVSTAAHVMREVEIAMRERLGTQTLKDLIASKP
ncbi:MAG TPA: YhjD/YihY/BrkB family envelope integrity protein [Steroidobacteraceae bacterium]|jgi:membrane protein|nr:YhjD/YihY/BrkB family envelope integrity protein [Steroidobacteraceae bacterium]